MVDFNKVTFTYDSAREPSIKNINFHVNRGEFLVLLGESGCGKTTIIRLINGLAPDFFNGNLEGRITVNSKNTIDYSIQELSKDIGMVYQDPRSQFIDIDTTSEIAFSCENAGLERDEIINRIDNTCKELDIEYLKDRNILCLSSGEKQMIAIASVYALLPKVIIMDEPSANLDMEAVQKLRRIIIKLKEKGFTIIISEHRLAYLHDIADRALFMKNGEISQILDKEKLRALNNSQLYKKGLRCNNLKELSVHNNEIDCIKNELLRFENICFCYKKGKKIFDKFSFTAYSGQVIGLVGHNGVGKTTTLDLICGLKRPDKGKVYINKNICKEKQRMKQTYLVMQDSDYQLFSDSVNNELYVGLDKNESMLIKGKKILELFDIYKYSKAHPATLSGGQKQRLSIAVSYMAEKTIICFDEPTSGLDYKNMGKVVLLIKELAKRGCCIVLSTHDYEFLLAACTDIIHIDDGKLKEQYQLNNKTKNKLYDLFKIQHFEMEV